jgi:hypothetical protein
VPHDLLDAGQRVAVRQSLARCQCTNPIARFFVSGGDISVRMAFMISTIT